MAKARSPLMNVMVSAALKAGKSILRDFGELDKLQVSRKGVANFATNADKRAEKILHQELSKARPDFSFLMEESGEMQGNDPTQRFVIDPIDGTHNFIHASPFFCVSIAYEKQLKNGSYETQAGVVYDPIHNDLFCTELYQGATLNDHRISVSPRTEIDACIIATYMAAREPHSMQVQSALMAQQCSWRVTGSLALDLSYVAAGRYDAVCVTSWKHWDVAAGKLLAREAGAKIMEVDEEGKKLLFVASPSVYAKLASSLTSPVQLKAAKLV